jgi:hypothetical protein
VRCVKVTASKESDKLDDGDRAQGQSVAMDDKVTFTVSESNARTTIQLRPRRMRFLPSLSRTALEWPMMPARDRETKSRGHLDDWD